MANTEAGAELTYEQAFSFQGCGAGTESACYALNMENGAMVCSIVAQQSDHFNMAGIMLGWRMNMDLTDNTPWCPKEMIPGSKKAETYGQELPS